MTVVVLITSGSSFAATAIFGSTVNVTSSNFVAPAFSNSGGGNFKSTFAVVPEPSAAILGMLSVVMLLRRRQSVR